MSLRCVVGGSRPQRMAAADRLAIAHGGPLTTVSAARWPFQPHVLPPLPHEQLAVIRIPDLHLAFPAGQTPGTRLVLTQSTYQLQRWLDWLEVYPNVTVVADAARAALMHGAAEAFARRGPWARIPLEQLEGDELQGDDRDAVKLDTDVAEWRRAFSVDADERLHILTRASADQHEQNPALQLAIGSVQMERDALQPAQDAINRAVALSPEWEAVWFEYGKLWLRSDDLARAAEQFAEAVRLMPSFAAAWSNLGAALAETERPDQAMAALEQALRYDPEGYPTLANLSVVYREAGRLDEAVEAARRVIALAPTFVFGHYNLGHALFLRGDFAAARDAYAEGHRRDPQKNPVQAGRLAISRAAAGDIEAAVHEMRALLARVSGEAASTIAAEADEILTALASHSGIDAQRLAPLLALVRDR